MTGPTRRAPSTLPRVRESRAAVAEEAAQGHTCGDREHDAAVGVITDRVRELAHLHARLARTYEELVEDAGIALAAVAKSSVSVVVPMNQAAKKTRRADDMLTQRELALLLHVTERTVRRMEVAGKVPPAVGRGRLKRWRRRDIERWLEDEADRKRKGGRRR